MKEGKRNSSLACRVVTSSTASSLPFSSPFYPSVDVLIIAGCLSRLAYVNVYLYLSVARIEADCIQEMVELYGVVDEDHLPVELGE